MKIAQLNNVPGERQKEQVEIEQCHGQASGNRIFSLFCQHHQILKLNENYSANDFMSFQ